MADPIRQLLSQTSYVADGVTTTWNFSFSGGYLDKAHVKAQYLDANSVLINIPVTLGMFVGAYQLSITPAVAAGQELTIYRDTPKDMPLVDFADKAALTEKSLDLNAKQAVFIAAESSDRVTTTVASSSQIQQLLTATIAQAQAAQASNVASAATLASFRGRYYGSLASDPAVDPNGNPADTGDQYFNSVLGYTKTFNGTTWERPSYEETAIAALNLSVTLVDNARSTALTDMTADKNAVDASRITAQASIEMSVGSAQNQANAATIQALNLAGITSTYATLSLATAALAGIAANAFVGVLADESKQGHGSVYQKVGGALVYVQYLAYPRMNQNGSWALSSYPRGSVLCQIGDSRTYESGVWGQVYTGAWKGKNGIFEGWTTYNMGGNGATLQVWTASIAGGNTSAPPTNADNINLWATVNANPQGIIMSLMTNDFRVSAGPDALAAKIVEARANFATSINFLLSRTSAVIVLRMPPPIGFANPDPGGWTDCVDANDAAARSAAIRMLHLEWLNVSDRVIVIDTHKTIYGYRIDSVAACFDPEGQGLLMGDTLHPLILGAARECQVIERTLNRAVPYTASSLSLGATSDVTTVFSTAHWLKTLNVVEAGTNYLRITRNPLAKLATVAKGTGGGALANLNLVQQAAYYSQLADMQEIKRLGQFHIYFHNTGNTFGPLTSTGFLDRPVNGDFQLSTVGTFGGNTGPATFYVTEDGHMPYASGSNDHITLALTGPQPLTVGAMGAASLVASRGLVTLGMPYAVRESNASTATVGIYLANTVSGGYGAAEFPGLELGILSFGNGFRATQFGGAGAWVANATNWPAGLTFTLGNRGAGTSVIAKVLTGSIGLYGQVHVPVSRTT